MSLARAFEVQSPPRAPYGTVGSLDRPLHIESSHFRKDANVPHGSDALGPIFKNAGFW